MCGILFELVEDLSSTLSDKHLLNRIACRGPDALATYSAASCGNQLKFTSSVLHLRGTNIVPQPFIDSAGNVLCWNGEAWAGLDMTEKDNDTEALANALRQRPDQVPIILESIRGPYAIVYFQVATNRVWYGRDILGRRSLMLHEGHGKLTLASVSSENKDGWQEVDTRGLRVYDLQSRLTALHKWISEPTTDEQLKKSYPDVNPMIPLQNESTGKHHTSQESAVTRFSNVLSEAVRIRTLTIPAASAESVLSETRVAVMFSGGVDCAVIARLLHDNLDKKEPIDLLNVSFENPRTLANAAKVDSSQGNIYHTPDRLTGLQGFAELMSSCPNRHWRFVEIDVPYLTAQAAKPEVLDLMYPNDSIMDYSIALAFYFCGKGIGTLCEANGHRTPGYRIAAKVFFSGLGADEQLGGYSRHAAAYRKGGTSALIAELQMDLDRIPSRNLGRDDRILSNFAREVRWPFLDENVITFLSNLHINEKMNFEVVGGDKWILREIARSLGIPQAAAEKKRAIQFGSRSARMEIEVTKSVKVKGHQKQR